MVENRLLLQSTINEQKQYIKLKITKLQYAGSRTLHNLN